MFLIYFTGLLITFIELIKNRNYNFWSHEFVQCAPEIQKLFESVARSCMVHSPPRMDNHGQPVPAAPGTGPNPQLGLTNEQQAQQQQVQQQQQQQQQQNWTESDWLRHLIRNSMIIYSQFFTGCEGFGFILLESRGSQVDVMSRFLKKFILWSSKSWRK